MVMFRASPDITLKRWLAVDGGGVLAVNVKQLLTNG
jgi:hypothetical protein